MSKVIYVNGLFLTNKITGIERYSCEVTKALSFFPQVKTVVVMPKGTKVPKDMQGLNIEFVEAGKRDGFFFEQITLPRFMKKHGKAPLLNMAMGAPVCYKNNFLTVHDVAFKERLSCLGKKWSFMQSLLLRLHVYKAKAIFTVSEFSASRIKYFYKKLKVAPTVVYPGIEHVLPECALPLEGLPEEFYFSSSSVHPNKNFQYVLALAKNNPDKFFVISGKKRFNFDEYMRENDIKNCIFTGYVSEENLMWLYSHCKGFILPSLYEGFGITPLEALAAGCKKLYLSDIPVFREVYKDVAEFFDPNDYVSTVQLNSEYGIGGGADAKDSFIKRFSWGNVAAAIAERIAHNNNVARSS